MMMFLAFVWCIFCIVNLSPAYGQNSTNPLVPDQKVEEYNVTQPYCFKFTWLGPEYDESQNVQNLTCKEYQAEKRTKGVPCRNPFVYTHDGSPPDIDYMFKYYKKTVLCRQSKGSVCAKYTYSFDNHVKNVTYMCTKAYAFNEGAVTKGCFKQFVNGYEEELCVCTSLPGGNKPCNAAQRDLISCFSMSATLVAFIVQYLLYALT